MVKIYVHKTDPDAVIPEVAYNNTSAAFDITCTEDTIIPPKSSGVVPNGLNVSIDQNDNYWMQIQLRSSLGFKQDLIPHYGTVDSGYTGGFGIKIFNVGDRTCVIKKGDRYAQVVVHEKPKYELIELNDEEFELFKEKQLRGDKGFGSSNN
jgi:dUTP pyrophosphatase